MEARPGLRSRLRLSAVSFSEAMDQDKQHVDTSQLVHLSQNLRLSLSPPIMRDIRVAVSNILLSCPSQDLLTIYDLSVQESQSTSNAISFSRYRLHNKH